jgi:hypothetical protein
MQLTKEDFKDIYKTLGNNDLLNMFLSRSQYTSIAIEAMTEEINSRGLNQEDLEGFLQDKVIEKDEFFQRVNFKELIFIEKLTYYYLSVIVLGFMFFFSWLASETSRQGYKLKIKQAQLYVTSSLIFLILADWIFPEYELYIWAAGFVIPLYFNFKSTKKRQQEFDRIYGKATINK